MKKATLIFLFTFALQTSAFCQNMFSVDVQNLTTCGWTQAEAFDASNNSLGIYTNATTMPANMGAPLTIMFCLPQASSLDHFEITSACGITTVPLTGATMCGASPCSSSVIAVISGTITCSGSPTQTLITLN